MCACRCYIALAKAAANLYCCSLVGPPDTGKTETIKDVAKCLGKFIVVFGCSYQIGVLGLQRIFKGYSTFRTDKIFFLFEMKIRSITIF